MTSALPYRDQPQERLVLDPLQRRAVVLEVIDSAREQLALSVFRCDDFKVLDALANAVHRKVRVRALLTPTAKNWDRRLQDLGVFLESMGAEVHRYAGAQSKYHAKYIVADESIALIASLNFTRKCFEKTCDFIVVTTESAIVSGLSRLFEIDSRTPDAPLPDELSGALIVGPEFARRRFKGLIEEAARSIRIVDHRVSDPEIAELLRARQKAGVSVQVLGLGAVSGLQSHGKLILVDDAAAAVGSISLSPPALNRRREVAAVVRDPANIAVLKRFFEHHQSTGFRPGEWSVPARVEEDDADDLD